jgi:hypothetical protein
MSILKLYFLVLSEKNIVIVKSVSIYFVVIVIIIIVIIIIYIYLLFNILY